MSAVATEHQTPTRLAVQRVAAVLGLVGGALGLLAGLVELTAGPSIRTWVGNKEDTTRLGLATLLLATIALAAAIVLARHPDALAPRRLGLAVSLALPGLIGYTTVGRLWYLPGPLLVTAAVLVAADLRRDIGDVAAAVDREWTTILTVALACLYIFLGATALGLAGALGVLGGACVLALVAVRRTIPAPLAVGLLVLAALPFAALTWWSVATPLIALLLVGFGPFALRPRPDKRIRS